jgi:hypothetical protein
MIAYLIAFVHYNGDGASARSQQRERREHGNRDWGELTALLAGIVSACRWDRRSAHPYRKTPMQPAHAPCDACRRPLATGRRRHRLGTLQD